MNTEVKPLPESLVSLQNVCKRFGDKLVLEDISLDIRNGEFISLIGPSGCGKSTLLRLLAHLTDVSSGSLVSTRALQREAALSYVFQEPTLLPWLTVAKNVELPLRISGMPQQERTAISSRLLETVGLSEAADFYPRQLSGGMKMRVSIARALSVSPSLLLLDEPFGALDEMTRDGLNEELLRIREANTWTAVFVTHSVSEAVFLSSRIIVLSANPGRIAQQIDIPLPFPRTPETRHVEAFSDLVRKTTIALHSVRQAAEHVK